MRFDLDEREVAKAAEWLNEQDDIIRKRQNLPEDGIPYYGAIGGAVTFSFTQTSLGIIKKVRHDGTNSELDLTDYAAW